eukprot:CAMPEP_0185038694 /NCGR_PEP_ID=MMETSP1103-20130426/34664_1 /TAXON_ID=36769 /ORGANISM="Paraphysomonas bandaiensis, Strain Caron Lab Isolate" /LENGTH=1615 /DNA_ID=CAMNT_0027577241 /DNA_START=46 /DNA_END=4893 /DNA_ORIENTATION=-
MTREEINDITLAERLLEVLSVNPSHRNEATESCFKGLSDINLFVCSSPHADYTYSLTVIGRTLGIALDHSGLSEMAWGVQAPVMIPDTGMVCGQFFLLARLLPVGIVKRVMRRRDVNRILVVGQGWSGAVAHITGLLLRQEWGDDIPVTCISISGPLCASPMVHNQLAEKNLEDRHITVCRGFEDRLLLDFQQFSFLSRNEFPSWSSVHESLIREVKRIPEIHASDGKDISIDFARIEAIELELSNHSDIACAGILPIGIYKLTNTDGSVSELRSGQQICNALQQLTQLQTGFKMLDNKELGQGCKKSEEKHGLQLSPIITSVRIVNHPFRTTFNFIGKNLDAVLLRGMTKEVPVKIGDIGMPFFVSHGDIEVDSTARILLVTCSDRRATVDISGIRIPGRITIGVRSDFGDSNTLSATPCTSKPADGPLVRALHPTMNGEFITGALMRVAVCSRECGNIEALRTRYPGMNDLWQLLLSVERLLGAETVLEPCMRQHVARQCDVHLLRNRCQERIEMIAEAVTELHTEENVFRFGARTALGGVSRVGGSILTAAGILLTLPSVILSAPAALAVARSNRRRAERQQEPRVGVGAGVYLGAVGLLSLPGLVVLNIGKTLKAAGVYAMQDHQSSNYRVVLKTLLSNMGQHPEEIVDEIAPLEESVVEVFESIYRGCKLQSADPDDVEKRIRAAAKATNPLPAAVKLDKYTRQERIIIKKLCYVGRICSIRRILENNLMIGFIGSQNSGKSTVIHRLFGVDTHPDAVTRTTEPLAHVVGSWVDYAASISAPFEEWLERDSRDMLQVYAVDFPGHTMCSDKSSGGAITQCTAELSSLFVVVLKAGESLDNEKDIINVAKSNLKPFIVVVNQCDRIQDELSTPGRYDSLREAYSRRLDVPSDMIHFTSTEDSLSFDRLRGLLFGMVQNLAGDPDTTQALALRFVPKEVIEDLRRSSAVAGSEVLSVAGSLSAAATSLLYNLSPLTSESLRESLVMYLEDEAAAEEQQTQNEGISRAETTALSGTFIYQLRHVACILQIDSETYAVFDHVLRDRMKDLSKLIGDKDKIPSNLKTALENYSGMENILTLLALWYIRQDIGQLMGTPVTVCRMDVQFLGTEILLSLNALVRQWIVRGHEPEVVQRSVREALEEKRMDLDDMVLMKIVLKNQTTATLLEADEQKSDGESEGIFDEYSAKEFDRFQLAKDQTTQLIKTTSFQPFNDFVRLGPPPSLSDEVLLEVFRDRMTSQACTNLKPLVISLPKKTNLVNDVITKLMSYSHSDLKRSHIRFSIEGEMGIDVNGVTRSVLSEAAAEINASPESVLLRKDDDTGLIYFDPDVCSSEDADLRQRAKNMYAGLGRLVGLCLVKSTVGGTLPINFPITVYRVLLGHRVGMSDLSIISPQVAVSMSSICMMDAETLDTSCLDFTVMRKDHSQFALVPNGGSKSVTIHNRVDFLRAVVKYYLCCMDDNTNLIRHFVLGVQSFCPRECFNHFTDVSLQLLIEGNRSSIDTSEWRAHTDYKRNAADDDPTVEMFWEVVQEMDDVDRRRLLCFSTGTTSLPYNGFSGLSPPFTLVMGSTTVNTLPSSHTCFHMLIMPKYTSKDTLREKVLLAIRETGVTELGVA